MRPWRVVLDTMFWVCAAANPAGAPGEIVRLARAAEFRIVISSAIHTEVLDVLTRPAIRSMPTARTRPSAARAPGPGSAQASRR